MKVLIVSTNFSPELTGTGKYSGEMADWLANNGHQVRVIASPPYYPEWKVFKDYCGWKYKTETRQNLKLFRCPIWVPKKTTGLKRIIHLLSFAISSFPIIAFQFFWRPAVVICIEPPFFNSIASVMLAKSSRAKSILHIQDFEVDAAFELGLIKAEFLKKPVYFFEKFILNRFDYVSTISKSMIKKLETKNTKSQKIFFPNWVDIEVVFPLTQTSNYRQKSNIGNEIVAMYSGNMGHKQGLEVVIESAKKLRKSNVAFIMCGNGVALDKLKSLSYGLTNIIWLPLQPLEQLNEFLNLADIHLLPQLSEATDLVMPSKLTGMLSSGRPVIAMATEGSEIEQVVRNCGVVVEPGDLTSFIKAIEKLANNALLRQKLGAKARLYAINHLDYQVIMNKFHADLIKTTT